jgi:hypothetical protein
MIYQYPWSMCLFINDNTIGSYMMGPHLVFSSLSDNTSTTLCFNSGQVAQAPSADLHDPMTLSSEVSVVGKRKDFGVVCADQ